MAKILGVGIATLDIINHVDGYPGEDSEVRALRQERVRGGNGANTAVVLSLLGEQCAFAGVLADEPDGQLVRQDLLRHGVDITPCRIEPRGKVPTSYVLLNVRNGSRSIVHYRDLPEYTSPDFSKLDLSSYQWLHFEGRTVDETERMLDHARTTCPTTPRSVEIEKPRPGIERLFAHADVLLFSRAFAEQRGFSEPQAFLHALRELAPQADLICAWGAQGACGLGAGTAQVVSSPAFAPPRIIDTLGAGDTFNAGFITARLHGLALEACLRAACRLAGAKCGRRGFAGLSRSDLGIDARQAGS